MNLDIKVIGILLFLILIILYFSWKHDEYIRNIMYIDETNALFLSKKEISIFKKVVNSSCNGVMRGAFIGYLTGGTQGAISGSLIYGLANPILTYTHHNLLSDDTLLNEN
jgi:hypothetical protein